MSQKVSRLGDKHDCGPGPITSASPNVYANGIKVARKTDTVLCTCYDPPVTKNIISGSSTVFVNGLPIARMGDSTSCPSNIIQGSDNVFSG